ncbi:hypothetical protein RKD18_001754 [Streptomyces phaeoluteigriseus]
MGGQLAPVRAVPRAAGVSLSLGPGSAPGHGWAAGSGPGGASGRGRAAVTGSRFCSWSWVGSWLRSGRCLGRQACRCHWVPVLLLVMGGQLAPVRAVPRAAGAPPLPGPGSAPGHGWAAGSGPGGASGRGRAAVTGSRFCSWSWVGSWLRSGRCLGPRARRRHWVPVLLLATGGQPTPVRAVPRAAGVLPSLGPGSAPGHRCAQPTPARTAPRATGAPPSPRTGSAPPARQSWASSSTRSSRPSAPCERAAMCHALRSKASPWRSRARSRPSSQARSPSL